MSDPRERYTTAGLLARADELTAAGYHVSVADADLWVQCIGPLEWLMQLESRIANAEMLKFTVEVRRNRCLSCGGSGWVWDRDMDGEHMRMRCDECPAGREVS